MQRLNLVTNQLSNATRLFQLPEITLVKLTAAVFDINPNIQRDHAPPFILIESPLPLTRLILPDPSSFSQPRSRKRHRKHIEALPCSPQKKNSKLETSVLITIQAGEPVIFHPLRIPSRGRFYDRTFLISPVEVRRGRGGVRMQIVTGKLLCAP